MHYVFRFILSQLYLWEQIISIILNYFIPIEIIDIIALPLHAALHVVLCLQSYLLSLRDHPNAHGLTNHILHPTPETGLRSRGVPRKRLCNRWGMVPVLLTGTTSSFPRIHHCIWYAPNNSTEQNDPCVWLIHALPMSRGVHWPAK